MASYTDQAGFSISLLEPPKRIVSLVPSQTELLADLGLDAVVTGITKFCVHPSSWKTKKKIVGGTKNLHITTIEALQPDLVIANKEENEKDQVMELRNKFPVWTSDIRDLNSALNMIRSVGEMTGTTMAASSIVNRISEAFNKLEKPVTAISAAYLIWQKPYMSVGSDTFIHSMMQYAGFYNVFSDRDRYPETSIEELSQIQPEYILLSSEPFPFRGQHVRELQERFPKSKCVLVDGEMFSWYGSRLLKAAAYLQGRSWEVGIGNWELG